MGDIEEKLLGDSLRLNQILMNLLSNALKFTPKGGRVLLRVTCLDRREKELWLRFEVEDTGCGIAEENFEKIFMAFEQENANVSHAYGGTGLGLSISKRFYRTYGRADHSLQPSGRGNDLYRNSALWKGGGKGGREPGFFGPPCSGGGR